MSTSQELPTVRDIRPEDEPDVAEIDRLSTAALRAVYRPTNKALAQRATIDPGLRCLVAVLDGRIAGVVHYYFTGSRLSFLGLGVHPRCQRRRETGNVAIFERLGFVVESEGSTDLFQLEAGATAVEVAMRKDLIQEV
jgi:ribosomal protein S18 acetylase RimI-like enzyme